MKSIINIVLFVLLFASCNTTTKEPKNTPKPNLEVEVQKEGQANVVDPVSDSNALKVAGPLSVFAPVDQAFDKLLSGTLETLLKPENKEQLATILKNHVAPTNYTINTLKKM
ncbi:fasciclin domain-containing protein [Polaribacter atrinae]|uniref:FAS1 domain-containing protein n=1 Tax=Polaribacter atrinae TaxID=1333662 RepID=A0A176SYV1_9FLAO|nr:fasciclin domain-containing protein [Polaribacter atrinae]OAD40780.1 hypothetical protein LPB303_16140 [Polaribacter atrinae]